MAMANRPTYWSRHRLHHRGLRRSGFTTRWGMQEPVQVPPVPEPRRRGFQEGVRALEELEVVKIEVQELLKDRRSVHLPRTLEARP